MWWNGGTAPRVLKLKKLDGGEWSASRPARFTPGTNLIGDWVRPVRRSGRGDEEKKNPASAGNRTPV